jgi:DNA-binding helix-hairpin-helix protein with protein kinase domain
MNAISAFLKFSAQQEKQRQAVFAKFVAEQEKQRQALLAKCLVSSSAHPQVNPPELVLEKALEPMMASLREALRK